MKKSQFFSIAATLSMLLFGCSLGNGSTFGPAGTITNGKESDATVKKNVKIGDFSKIDASQGIKIVYTQGKNQGQARVATTPSAVDYLKVYVKNGCLYARYEGDFDRIKGPSIVTVSSNKLTGIDLSAAAQVNVASGISQSDGIDIDLSSAAQVDFQDVDCPEIGIDISSSAKVNIAATTANLDIECSSASSVKVGTAKCDKADIELSSAADVSIDRLVRANLEIEASSAAKASIQMDDCGDVNAEASSGASVKLYGNCRSLRKDSSSRGKVTVSGSALTCLDSGKSVAATDKGKAIADGNKKATKNKSKAKKGNKRKKTETDNNGDARLRIP